MWWCIYISTYLFIYPSIYLFLPAVPPLFTWTRLALVPPWGSQATLEEINIIGRILGPLSGSECSCLPCAQCEASPPHLDAILASDHPGFHTLLPPSLPLSFLSTTWFPSSSMVQILLFLLTSHSTSNRFSSLLHTSFLPSFQLPLSPLYSKTFILFSSNLSSLPPSLPNFKLSLSFPPCLSFLDPPPTHLSSSLTQVFHSSLSPVRSLVLPIRLWIILTRKAYSRPNLHFLTPSECVTCQK